MATPSTQLKSVNRGTAAPISGARSNSATRAAPAPVARAGKLQTKEKRGAFGLSLREDDKTTVNTSSDPSKPNYVWEGAEGPNGKRPNTLWGKLTLAEPMVVIVGFVLAYVMYKGYQEIQHERKLRKEQALLCKGLERDIETGLIRAIDNTE
jgi:hypothetical protein